MLGRASTRVWTRHALEELAQNACGAMVADWWGAAHRTLCAEACATLLGGAVNTLLILIPAFNEEGAVGNVVREVKTVLPDVPVLVVDDCSGDSTIGVARAAG